MEENVVGHNVGDMET